MPLAPIAGQFNRYAQPGQSHVDGFRAYGAVAGTVVVAVRDALLLALTVLAFVRLWRSTRRPGDLAEPAVMPSEQELHGPRAGGGQR